MARSAGVLPRPMCRPWPRSLPRSAPCDGNGTIPQPCVAFDPCQGRQFGMWSCTSPVATRRPSFHQGSRCPACCSATTRCTGDEISATESWVRSRRRWHRIRSRVWQMCEWSRWCRPGERSMYTSTRCVLARSPMHSSPTSITGSSDAVAPRVSSDSYMDQPRTSPRSLRVACSQCRLTYSCS